MSDILQLQNVSKFYHRGSEKIAAVKNISVSFKQGDFAAIIGPSGSGKTTLLNLLGCVDKVDIGTFFLDGENVTGLKESALTKIRARKIGFVFQQFFLLPTLSAQENVQLPALFLRDSAQSKSAAELLERVHLGNRLDHLPRQLSGGEMQRVAIARALMNNPKILLADEPTGNLDSTNAKTILDIFQELNADGLTILMVTHNAELAQKAKYLIELKDGVFVTKQNQI